MCFALYVLLYNSWALKILTRGQKTWLYWLYVEMHITSHAWAQWFDFSIQKVFAEQEVEEREDFLNAGRDTTMRKESEWGMRFQFVCWLAHALTENERKDKERESGEQRTEDVFEFRSPVSSSAFPCTLTSDLTLIWKDKAFRSLCACFSLLFCLHLLIADSQLSIPEYTTHYIVAICVFECSNWGYLCRGFYKWLELWIYLSTSLV